MDPLPDELNERLVRILERVEILYAQVCGKLREPADRCIECREPATCNWVGVGLRAAYCEAHAAFSMDWAPALEVPRPAELKIDGRKCKHILSETGRQCQRRASMGVRGSPPDRCTFHCRKGYTQYPQQKCALQIFSGDPGHRVPIKCGNLAVFEGDAQRGAHVCMDHKWSLGGMATSVEICCDCEQLCVADVEVKNLPGRWRCTRCFRGTLPRGEYAWYGLGLPSNEMMSKFIESLAPQWQYELQNLVWSHRDVITLRLGTRLVVIDRSYGNMPFELEAYIQLAYRNLYTPQVAFLITEGVTKKILQTLYCILCELADMREWPSLSYMNIPYIRQARFRPLTYREDSQKLKM